MRTSSTASTAILHLVVWGEGRKFTPSHQQPGLSLARRCLGASALLQVECIWKRPKQARQHLWLKILPVDKFDPLIKTANVVVNNVIALALPPTG